MMWPDTETSNLDKRVRGPQDRFGRGIALAESVLQKNGSPKLEYVVGENHLAVIVRKHP